MKRNEKLIVYVMAASLLTFAAGCRKKAPVAAAPSAPAPAAPAPQKPVAPTISEFTAEPGAIQRGQSALLRWQVKDATEVEIGQGIGAVAASGRRQVSPQDSTTYTLIAKGPGGSATASATLNVTLPPPPIPTPAPAPDISERLTKEVSDAFFDFDRSELREDARTALTQDAKALSAIMKDFPDAAVVIEGHCDERGSGEYNIGLGERRADAAKEFLTQLGLPAARLVKISYGKERPQCTESNESCWQKNRRVHFAPGEKQQPGTAAAAQPANGDEN